MKKENIIGKIALNIYAVAQVFLFNIFMKWASEIEGISNNINNTLVLTIYTVITVCFWVKKDYRKTFIIITGILILLLFGNYYYYENLSSKVETYIYLKQKYNINYDELELIDSWDNNQNCLDCATGPRGAIYKYKEKTILLAYFNKWYDSNSYKKEADAYVQEYFDEELEFLEYREKKENK